MTYRGHGVAYEFWLLVERTRAEQGLTKTDLWNMMKARAGDGPSPARSTIDNLRDSTRAPSPRIVHALADALNIDRGHALELAGLVPSQRTSDVDVRSVIEASSDYTADQKSALLFLIDTMDQVNATSRASRADRAESA